MKYTKKVVMLLAAHWGKDPRTIKSWIKKKNPLLTHPDSISIVKNNQ